MPDPRYSGKWAKVRLLILARDGYRCQIRGPGCTDVAVHVDHIEDPNSMDPANLRASCAHCNSRVAALKGNALRGRRVRRVYRPTRDW